MKNKRKITVKVRAGNSREADAIGHTAMRQVHDGLTSRETVTSTTHRTLLGGRGEKLTFVVEKR
ncbi:hypothetical protein GCM10023195_84160 [Actinoallomurus liliacearum]|uniref:Uncharacterized protein n=1 Tax=Actinoallomurus liliacearum TaxID=1080073 RepID=A0ABP8U0V9_9ACTN